MSLMLILHPRIGGPATANVLAHTVSGLVGFSLCCLAARLLVPVLGNALGLTLALGVSVAANVAIWALRRRSVSPLAPELGSTRVRESMRRLKSDKSDFS